MAVRLEAHTEELLSVAAALAASAHTLAGLPGLSHPPLAADEVSVTAAERLSMHGGVLASRADDAAAVLASAAQALSGAVRAYTEMDVANASAVSLGGDAGFVGPAITPAATADLPTLAVPISPPAPRDGEVAAALLEAGNPEAGAGFVSGCGSYASAFRDGAVAVRGAQASVAGALQGEAAPQIGTALGRFADWADSMGEHAEALGELASGHRGRFLTARHDTPSTRDFEATRRELVTADELNRRSPGAYSGVVAGLQTQLAGLHTRAAIAGENFYAGESSAVASPPPPVVAIASGTSENPGADQDGSQPDRRTDGSVSDGLHAAVDGAGEPALTASGEPRMAGSVGSALPMMAAALPSMLAGALGGVVGMVAAVPEQIGQQLQSLASEAVQGVSGLASGMGKPDPGAVSAQRFPSPGDAGDPGDGVGGDAGGGSGGVTDPAAGTPLLPSSDAGMLAAGTAPTPAPLVGQASTATGVPAADAAPGGMPMMMPGMGMGPGGGAGTRPVSEPDKAIHLPADPNAAPVKGDVMRRTTAVSDNPTAKQTPAVTVTSSSQGRRIVVPKQDGGD